MEGAHEPRGIARAALAVAAIVLLVPAGASAATQTLGSLTPDATTPGDCSAGDTWVERSSSGVPYAAPGLGVITSWSMRGGATPSQVKLKLLQPASPGDSAAFTARAETEAEPIAAGSTDSFPARIPVNAGYILGLHVVSGTAACRYAVGSNDDSTRRVVGDVPVGSTATFDAPTYQERLNLSAVLEDDADGDGFGDATQDGCPASAETQGPCPPTVDDPAGRLYVALGDSWSQGVGASTPAKDWVHLFFDHLRSAIGATTLSNRSIGGQSTDQVINGTQLSSSVADINAASDTVAVTLQIGGNDARLGCRDDCFRDNHATILAALRSALDTDPGDELLITGGYGNPSTGLGNNNESGADLVLLGNNLSFSCADTEPNAGILEATSQNATRYGALFANPYEAIKQGGQTLISPDGVHPNDAGHAVVEAAFEAAAPGCGDEIPPVQTLSLKTKQPLDDLSLTDAVDEAATIVVAGKVPLPGKDAKLKPDVATLPAAGSAELTPALKGKALKKVTVAVEERKLRARLTVTATDAAGNASVENATVMPKGRG